MQTKSTMLKVAYLKGIKKAAEQTDLSTDFLKEAGVGTSALKWLGKKLYQPAQRLYADPTVAKGVGSTLQRVLGLAPSTVVQGARGLIPEAGRFIKNIAGFGFKPATGVAGMAAPGTGMSRLYKALTFGGRNVPSQMLQYGALSGALGGLTGGAPGEGWSWSGAGKGFLGGAAGGLGWAAGGRLVRGGLGKMLSSKALLPGGRLAGFAERGKKVWNLGGKQPGFWSQRIPGTMHKGIQVAETPSVGFGSLGKELFQSLRAPTGAGVRGAGDIMKDIGTKAALGVPIAAGVLGTSLGAEEAVNRRLNRPEGTALSPQGLAIRGAYSMTPGGRAAYYY